MTFSGTPWWRHQMETFSALLAICAGNSPVPSEFPTQRPVTRSFDVIFDLHLNKRFSKQSWGWWSETPSCPLWRNRNAKLYLSNFEPASIEEISKLIRDSPNKSCSLDPIPYWLTKNVLILYILESVNLSLSTGKMPDDCRNAMFIPLLKQISRPRHF